MDPISQLLSPFVPLAALVAALVAFVRYGLSKMKANVDGWGVVALAAVLSVLVCAWTQLRLGPVDWTKVALDAPAVLVLAAGGTAWAKRLRSAPKSEEDASSIAATVGEKLVALSAARPVQVSAVVEVEGETLARTLEAANARSGLSAEDFSFAKDAEPEIPEAPPSLPAPASP